MEPIEILLSDQFISFSERIASIASNKKQLKVEFKSVYDKFQADLKELDNAALEAQNEFEAWKKERQLAATDS